MKIIESSPFNNENLVAGFHIGESTRWVDEFHITESNRTFQYIPKDFNFRQQKVEKVFYHKLDSESIFLKPRKYIPHLKWSRKPGYHPKVFRKTAWYNDGMQRNKSLPPFEDDDIVIFSDVDEIIDSRYADRIVEEVKKRGMITVRLHFTLFYFNLFSLNWAGPPDYSYRVFVVRGNILREQWHADVDTIRKLGEGSKLSGSIYCLPEIVGFHHSWLGDEEFISRKLEAYAHLDHREYDAGELIRRCLKTGSSLFKGHKLAINDSISLLPAIELARHELRDHFLSL